MLTKEQILQHTKMRTTLLEVPEWGGEILVREMTGAQRDAWDMSVHEDKKAGRLNIRASLAAYTVCDQDGRLLFSPADIAALSALSGTALDRVFTAAQQINHIGDEDIEAAEKNS